MAAYENEIESCMNDIAKCQDKISNLKQKTQERNIHKDSYSSNLKIMEDWLENVKNSNLQKHYESERYYTELEKKIKDRNSSNENERNEFSALRRRRGKFQSQGDMQCAGFPPSFHNTNIASSEFMINFIDATHNIFQIQQKQIEELQDIITKQQSL